MFEALFVGTICLSAAALTLLVVLLARRPPGKGA